MLACLLDYKADRQTDCVCEALGKNDYHQREKGEERGVGGGEGPWRTCSEDHHSRGFANRWAVGWTLFGAVVQHYHSTAAQPNRVS